MVNGRQSARRNGGLLPGRLRIVAGKWRSRLLPVAEVAGLRPTSERVRETLFNWLAPTIDGASCLDLYAGSGALGFEALSRGAANVRFVEKSKVAVNVIRANIDALEASGANVRCADAMQYLHRGDGERFDLVFLDPPFATENLQELCRLLQQSGRLAAGARIYLEQDKGRSAPALPNGWSVWREKTAGKVRYSLLEAGGKSQ